MSSKRKLSEFEIQPREDEIYKRKKSKVECSNLNQNLTDDNNIYTTWELNYFVTKNEKQVICLLCRKVLSLIKQSDVKEHFTDLHQEQFINCYTNERLEILNRLKNSNFLPLVPLITTSPRRSNFPEDDNEVITLDSDDEVYSKTPIVNAVINSEDSDDETVFDSEEEVIVLASDDESDLITEEEVRLEQQEKIQLDPLEEIVPPYVEKMKSNAIDRTTMTLKERKSFILYSITLEIAKSVKNYSDGEIIRKEELKKAQETGDQEKIQDYSMPIIQANTISSKMSKLGFYILKKIEFDLRKCAYFSLCLDENIEKCLLMIFVRIVQQDFTVREELLNIIPTKNLSFNNNNIVKIVTNSFKKLSSVNKCSSISFYGKRFGLEFLNLFRSQTCISSVYQCQVKLNELTRRSLERNQIIIEVERIAFSVKESNKEKSNNLQLFAADLEEIFQKKSKESVFSLLCEFNTFAKFFNSRQEIHAYLKTDYYQSLLEDSCFLSLVAFLADVSTMIERLNLNIQKPEQTIIDLMDNLREFRAKLQSLLNQIEKGKFIESSYCYQLAKECSMDYSEIRPILNIMIDELNLRLDLLNVKETQLQLFENPLSVNIEQQPIELQVELCYLQAEVKLIKSGARGLEFFKILNHERFPKLKDFGLRILSMFGSTSICERAHILAKKSEKRRGRPRSILKEFIRVAVSKQEINIMELIKKKHQ